MIPIATAYPSLIILKEIHIVGSCVGNRKEAIETLDLAKRGLVSTHFSTASMYEVSGH